MNKEKGLDERPKWQDATEGDLGHEQAVGTTGKCYWRNQSRVTA